MQLQKRQWESWNYTTNAVVGEVDLSANQVQCRLCSAGNQSTVLSQNTHFHYEWCKQQPLQIQINTIHSIYSQINAYPLAFLCYNHTDNTTQRITDTALEHCSSLTLMNGNMVYLLTARANSTKSRSYICSVKLVVLYVLLSHTVS
jgi:hypothetical protein